MKKSVKILIIIAVVMVVLGLGLCVGGAMGGGLNGLKSEPFVKIHDQIHAVEIGGEKSNQYSANDIIALDIEMSGAELEIVETGVADKFEVLTDSDKVRTKVKNKTLYIEADSDLSGHHLVTVEIPKDVTLERLEVNIGAGAVSIESINAIDAEFEVGAGEIIVEDGHVDECSVNVGMGNFEYTGAIARECDVECDMGNVDIFITDLEEEDYNYEYELGAGEIVIGHSSFAGIGSEKYINNQAPRNMELECSMGSLNINFGIH